MKWTDETAARLFTGTTIEGLDLFGLTQASATSSCICLGANC